MSRAKKNKTVQWKFEKENLNEYTKKYKAFGLIKDVSTRVTKSFSSNNGDRREDHINETRRTFIGLLTWLKHYNVWHSYYNPKDNEKCVACDCEG